MSHHSYHFPLSDFQGYFISCVAANVQMALALAPPFMIPILLFGGYFLNSE